MVNALRDGADLDVRFLPFSLDQAHVEEGEPPVWERDPSEWGTGTTALLYGIAVRDAFPEKFLDAHVELFAQRHDHGMKLGHEDVLEEAIARVGLDVDAVKAEVWSGRPLEDARGRAHEAVELVAVFGVPTFCEGEEAVFIRFMERGRADDLAARARPARLDPPQRVQAHDACRADRPTTRRRCRADVAERGDHVGGREGPGAPLRLLNLTVLDAHAATSTGCARQGRAGARRRIPRLAERVVSPPLRIAPPEWRPDPTLDLDYHLRRVALPEPGSMRDLLDVAADHHRAAARPVAAALGVHPRRGARGRARRAAAAGAPHDHRRRRRAEALAQPRRLRTRPRARRSDDTVRARRRTSRAAERRDEMLDDPLDRDSPLDVLRDAIGDRAAQNVELAQRGVGRGVPTSSPHPPRLPGARPGRGRARSRRCAARCSSPTAATSALLATRSLGRRYDVFAVEPRAAATAPARRSAGASTTSSSPGSPARSAFYHDRLGTPVESCAWRCR